MLDILKNNNEQEIINNIIDVYCSFDNPFVIAFSGGKDSTYLLHVFFDALKQLAKDGYELKNKLYIITSDTLVEEPKENNSIEDYFYKIKQYAKQNNFEQIIETKIVKPRINQRYFFKLIGKGYSIPVNNFRWCTTDLKIDPINNAIRSISKDNDIIVTTGTRKEESTSRDELLSTFNEKNLSYSNLSEKIINFSPIMNVKVADIWNYLLKKDDKFWLNDNSKLYSDYTIGDTECPIIISNNDLENKNAKGGCGSSRFGCWTCTLISNKQKTSMEKNAEINNDQALLELAKFRYELIKYRTDDTMRSVLKRDNSIPIVRGIKPIIRNGEKQIKVNVRSHQDKNYIPISHLNVSQDIKMKSELKKIDDYKNEYGYFIFNSESKAKKFILDYKIFIVNEFENQKNANIINKIYIKDGNNFSKIGRGPFTHEARVKILKNLLSLNLNLQKEKKYKDIFVIDKEEIDYILNFWLEEGFDKKLWLKELKSRYEKLYKVEIESSLQNIETEIGQMLKFVNLYNNKRDSQILEKEIRKILMKY